MLFECRERLVGVGLLDHQEQRRGAGLQVFAYLALEVFADALLFQITQPRTDSGA